MAKCSLRPVVSAAILPTSTVSPTIKNKTKLGALRMAAVVLALGVVCPLAAHAVGSASQMVVLSQPTLLPFNNNSYVYNFFSGGTAGLFTVAEEDANNNIVVDGGGISLTISSSGGTCYLGTTSGSVTTATVSTTSPLSSNTTYPYTITPTYSNGVATFDLSTLNLNATGSVCTYGFKFSGVNNSVSTSGTASSPGTGTGNLSPIELVAPTSNLFIVTTNVDPGSSPSCPAFTTMQTTATLALSANNNCPFRTAFSNMKNTASAQVIFYSSAWPMTITLASTLDGTNNTAPLFVIGPGPNNLFISGGCAVGSSPAVGSGCASNTVGGIKGGSTSTSAATFLEGFTMENFHDGSTSGAVNLTGGPNLFNNMNFDYNEYDGGGGAIAIGKYAPTGTLINNSQFIGNTSSLTNTAASGGGISYVGNGPLSITNSLIVANSNVGNWTSSNGGQLIGGALYMKPGQTIVNVGASAYNLANDSFIGNYVSQTGTQGNSTGGHSGAAFYATQSASLTAASGVYVTNDTMYGNFSSTNTTSYTYGAVYTICSSCAATMTDYITSSLFTGNAAANSNTTSSNTYPVRGGAWYQSSTNTTVYNSVMEGDLVFDAGCTVSGSCNTTVYGPDDNASSFTAGTATDLTTTGSTGSWASGHTYPGVGALGSGSTVDGLGLSDLGMGVGFVQITAAGSYTSGAPTVTLDSSSGCTVLNSSTGVTTTHACCTVTPVATVVTNNSTCSSGTPCAVTGLTITNPGAGCVGPPPVTFSSGTATGVVTEMASLYGGTQPSWTSSSQYTYGGLPATFVPLPGTATTGPVKAANGIPGTEGVAESVYGTVQAVQVMYPGSYTYGGGTPTITFNGGGCTTEPTATAVMGIASVTVTAPGNCTSATQAITWGAGCSVNPTTVVYGASSSTSGTRAIDVTNTGTCTGIPTISSISNCTTSTAAAAWGVTGVTSLTGGAGCTSAPTITFSGGTLNNIASADGVSAMYWGGQASAVAVTIPITDARGAGNRTPNNNTSTIDLGPVQTCQSTTGNLTSPNCGGNTTTLAVTPSQPSSLNQNSGLTLPVAAQLQDDTYPVVTKTLSTASLLSLSNNGVMTLGNGGTLGGTPTVTPAVSSTTGYLNASWSSLTVPATAYPSDYLTATISGFNSGSVAGNSNTFNITAAGGNANKLAWQTAPSISSAQAGQASGTVTATALIQDSSGNTTSAYGSTPTLTLKFCGNNTCTAGGDPIASVNSSSVSSGVASFSLSTFTLPTTAGTYYFYVICTSNCSGTGFDSAFATATVTQSQTVSAYTPTAIAWGTAPGASEGAGASVTVTANLTDTYGNLVGGDSLTLNVCKGAGASCTGANLVATYSATSSASGATSFSSVTAPTTTGQYTYKVSYSSFTASQPATVTGGAAHVMVVLTAPLTGFSSGGNAGLMQVAEEDSYGNILTSANGIKLTMSGGTTTAGPYTTGTATLTSVPTPTYVGGVATFDLSSVPLLATSGDQTYTFTFADAGGGGTPATGTSPSGSSPTALVHQPTAVYIVTEFDDTNANAICTNQVSGSAALDQNCTLRAAVLAAAGLSTAQSAVIEFSNVFTSTQSWPQTINLTSNLNAGVDNWQCGLTIAGPGPNNLFISGAPAGSTTPTYSGLKVNSAATAAFYLSGLTMEYLTTSTTSGGALYITTGTTVSNVNFVGNTIASTNGGNGAAIASYTGNTGGLTINNSQFLGNTASYSTSSSGAITGGSNGGAIYFTGSTSSLSISNSTFLGNAAGYEGGALYAVPVSTCTNNCPPQFSLSNDLFAHNTAGLKGGATFFAEGQAQTLATLNLITNSTFYANYITPTATTTEAGASFLGGNSTSEMPSATVFQNDLYLGNALAGTSGNTGGAIYADSLNDEGIINTIIEGNLNVGGASGTMDATMNGKSYNVISSSKYSTGATTDYTYPGLQGMGLSDLGEGVGYVQVLAGGGTYSSAPSVTFDSGATCTVVGGNGSTTTSSCCTVTPSGTAVMSGSGSTQSVASITITNPGAGCIAAPPVAFGSGSAVAVVTSMTPLYGGAVGTFVQMTGGALAHHQAQPTATLGAARWCRSLTQVPMLRRVSRSAALQEVVAHRSRPSRRSQRLAAGLTTSRVSRSPVLERAAHRTRPLTSVPAHPRLQAFVCWARTCPPTRAAILAPTPTRRLTRGRRRAAAHWPSACSRRAPPSTPTSAPRLRCSIWTTTTSSTPTPRSTPRTITCPSAWR